MSRHAFVNAFGVLFVSLSLSACGGGDVSIGGTLSGLPDNTTVVLQNNAGDNLTLSNDGDFTFSETVTSGDAYAVTVLTQPTGAVCSVTNGSGTVATADVLIDDVTVTCVSNASIVGTVSGLASGTAVTLSNGSTTLAVASNGAFAFPGVLAAGTAYAVTVSTPPAGQGCTVANGAGTVVSGSTTSIAVTCS